ncbi:MAG TPA: serine/threonine-protein kinase [Ktedonobacteraceae bacterium]|nr:serine/threonine-protein kinase [Ktedonobacteraceae bacterium]
MEELEGTIFGHYLLKRRLARGGMSQVYLACDQDSQQEVAIKIVSREDSEHASRFQREIKALGNLSHKHILPTLDYGEEGQWLYMVMPYIEHGTLRDLLHTKGRLTPEEAGKILVQVCAALQFAHDHGVIHRDIKPSNILLQRGEHAYLADFGLAKEVDQSSELTQTGYIIGTPEYMAPELAEQSASKSSDIYALGIVLYQMLTGKTPFRGTTPLAVYWKHMQEQPLPPSLLEPSIPVSVEQVVMCALEKDPRLRFKSAQALARAYAQSLLYARRTREEWRITAPPATAARVPMGPLPVATPTAPEKQNLFDMRRITGVATQNRVDVERRAPLSRKVMTGVLAATLLVAIPFSFGYSLYSSAAHTQTVWGASALFSTALENAGKRSGFGKLPPASTTTASSTTDDSVIFYPRSSPPPPPKRPSPPPPPKQKHGHKHGHGDR